MREPVDFAEQVAARAAERDAAEQGHRAGSGQGDRAQARAAQPTQAIASVDRRGACSLKPPRRGEYRRKDDRDGQHGGQRQRATLATSAIDGASA